MHRAIARKRIEGRAGEEGYVLLGVLFLVFLVMVALAIAAPRMAASIERDREVELQHRANQYKRAIKLYYKKFGAYPPTIEALEKQNEIRFLRKRYKDPITGKADWKTIAFGQNKMPTAYGFFGQPMAGSSIAGTGPGAAGMGSGGLFGNSATGIGATGIGSSNSGSAGFGSSGFGSSGSGSSGFGSSGLNGSNASGTSGSGTSSSGTSGSGATGSGTGAGSTDGSGNSSGGSGSAGDSGSGSSSGGGAAGSGTAGSGTSGGSSSGSGFGSGSGNGQTFGGAGIIGVESTSAKKSILEYHKKTHFNEWEFVYDPMADQLMLSNNTNIGTPASGLNPNGVATPGTFGNQPTNTTIPPLPQQQQQQQQGAPQQ